MLVTHTIPVNKHFIQSRVKPLPLGRGGCQCRKHAHHIAQKRFGGVQYRSGVFYNRRALEADAGFQMDLVFDREDKVITVCEIKYTQAPVVTRVIAAFEKKLTHFANPKNKTIHKVLIAANNIDTALARRHYFDVVLTLSDLMSVLVP